MRVERQMPLFARLAVLLSRRGGKSVSILHLRFGTHGGHRIWCGCWTCGRDCGGAGAAVSVPTANRIGNQMLASTIETTQPQAKQDTALQKFIIIRSEAMIKMGWDIYLFVFVQYPIILLIEKLGSRRKR